MKPYIQRFDFSLCKAVGKIEYKEKSMARSEMRVRGKRPRQDDRQQLEENRVDKRPQIY